MFRIPPSLRSTLILLVALAATACGLFSAVETGAYRAVIKLSGGELPFRLALAQEKGKTIAWITQGGERLRLEQVTLERRRLEIALPGGGLIKARPATWKGLRGEVVLRQGNEERRFTFTAERDGNYLFFKKVSTDNADVSGRWIVDVEGAPKPATFVLEQRFHEVSGEIVSADGKIFRLDGEVHDNSVRLGGFDGAQARLFVAERNKQGEFTGHLYDAQGAVRTFSARPEPEPILEDPEPVL